MLEKVIKVLPTIGKIAGCLLTNILGEEGEDKSLFLSYDLTPETGKNGVTDCEALFTNENGDIYLSNHGISKKKDLRVRFPQSPVADVDDAYIPDGKQIPLNEVLKTHAEQGDGQLELSAVDAVNAVNGGTSTSEILTYTYPLVCGAAFTPVPGDRFKLNLSEHYFTVAAMNPEDKNFVIARLFLLGNDFQTNINMQMTKAIPGENTQSLRLPKDFIIRDTYTAEVSLEVTHSGDHLKRSYDLCRPISERTKHIIENGRRVY